MISAPLAPGSAKGIEAVDSRKKGRSPPGNRPFSFNFFPFFNNSGWRLAAAR